MDGNSVEILRARFGMPVFYYFFSKASCLFPSPHLPSERPPGLAAPPLPRDDIHSCGGSQVGGTRQKPDRVGGALTCSEELNEKGKWCHTHAAALGCWGILLSLRHNLGFSAFFHRGGVGGEPTAQPPPTTNPFLRIKSKHTPLPTVNLQSPV